jgi:hypothetical protein
MHMHVPKRREEKKDRKRRKEKKDRLKPRN